MRRAARARTRQDAPGRTPPDDSPGRAAPAGAARTGGVVAALGLPALGLPGVRLAAAGLPVGTLPGLVSPPSPVRVYAPAPAPPPARGRRPRLARAVGGRWARRARTAPPPDRTAAPGRPAPPAAAAVRAGGGSRPTLAELYHARRLDMVRLALFLVDDLPTAEDVVQDAFTAVCRRHGTALDDLDDAAAYLHTAVVNAARSVLRRRRTARAYTPPHHSPAAPLDEGVLLAEEHQQVLDALQRLTRRQREVLVLRYWSDLSEAQIAQTLGLSRGTVKSTASRALDALERLLEAPA